MTPFYHCCYQSNKKSAGDLGSLTKEGYFVRRYVEDPPNVLTFKEGASRKLTLYPRFAVCIVAITGSLRAQEGIRKAVRNH